jgi:hypothetical protein
MGEEGLQTGSGDEVPSALGTWGSGNGDITAGNVTSLAVSPPGGPASGGGMRMTTLRGALVDRSITV